MDISVVIITYNEEDRLEPTLKSVADIASEIIIVDSYSTDDTIKIARKYTDKIIQRKWTNYSSQKNFANSKATFPWILSLDADERLSPELQEEILGLEEKNSGADAYSMPRRVFYLGRWIRHTVWYPDRKIRLFRREKAHWEGEYVHESLVVKGKVQELKAALLHYTYRNIHDHISRLNTFSYLGAQKLYAQGKRCGAANLFFLPIFGFVKSYFLKAGFLDGFAGFVVSVLHGFSIFLRYAKLREIWKKGEKIELFPG